MRKRIFYNCLIAASFVIGMAFMTGCEGPAGPAGPAGPTGADGAQGAQGEKGDDGTPGVAGNVTCLECHSIDTPDEISTEFHRSVHSAGAIAVDYAGGRTSCAQCHSHEGYVEFAATGDVAETILTPSAWECKTCHNIHTTFEKEDYAFRLGDDVTLIANGSPTIAGENNNTCINCHQSRRDYFDYDDLTVATVDTMMFTDDDDVAFYGDPAHVAFGPNGGILNLTEGLVDPKTGETYDSLTVAFDIPLTHAFISSTHAGPHHGPQGQVWVGLGGYEDGDAFDPHSGGCVECHMGPASGHSFKPKDDNCIECHDDGKETARDAFEEDLIEIAHALEAIHAVHIDEMWDINKDGLFGGVHPIYASLTKAQFQAWWNFTLLMEDRSNTAHNPTYMKALLADAQTKLGL